MVKVLRFGVGEKGIKIEIPFPPLFPLSIPSFSFLLQILDLDLDLENSIKKKIKKENKGEKKKPHPSPPPPQKKAEERNSTSSAPFLVPEIDTYRGTEGIWGRGEDTYILT